ncbi:mechanosensitive ion channel family protein [Vibrio sp. SM6]|uniref:Mechanosensitive ion channel family protein n=1 Tax=Vibrio agarilyticus TaxID=2726741 RepID=A0A7X8YH40_9VIBR|nr:mechanosensitive ion channel family protein [Vibrio agarilyticus]NLS13061.1 mechanosensitive ion channel family protein [Vibrio agarilyticus]
MGSGLRAYVTEYLKSLGVTTDPYGIEPTIVLVLAAIGVATISYLIVHRIILRALHLLLSKTQQNFSESFSKFRVLEKIAMLVPALILELFIPIIVSHHPTLSLVIDRSLTTLILILFIWVLFAILDSLNDLASKRGFTRKMPIKSFVQLIKLFTFLIGIFLSVSILIDQSPVIFLSGLGVATGLVMLVFRDTILGFVAGIQLSANNMVSLNDWIEMDQFGANGTVEEVALTTVKVRNFDNTVTMLPAYALVQNAFRNWQSMTESGGRRIIRSVNIDVNSIRFLTEDEIEELKKIRILREYLFDKTREVTAFNEGLEEGDKESVGNQRHITNIGTFRAYLTTYLRTHPDIHPYMLFMVRQLAPTSEGLPLQVYAFVNNTNWVFYEGVQADLFDHIYSVMPLFGLRPYQMFGGNDTSRIPVPAPIDASVLQSLTTNTTRQS